MDGRDDYLGLHGSEASLAAYHRLIAICLQTGRKFPATLSGRDSVLTVNEMLVGKLDRADRSSHACFGRTSAMITLH